MLTFDYELYFNECDYTEEEVLINPTEELIDCLDRNCVKGTFFVDTPSVDAYLKKGLNDYPLRVKEQIKKMLDSSHDVQLHIHPIWYKANYEDSKWTFDNNFYSLDSFENCSDIIHSSKKLLDSMADNHKNYNCCAFRAGGFCFTPERVVIQSLLREGIKIDSSVCINSKIESIGQNYDYTNITKKINWYFDEKSGIGKSTDARENTLFEIPVGTYGCIPQKWLLTHAMPKLNYPPIKGKRSLAKCEQKSNKLQRIFSRIGEILNVPVLFTMDSLHEDALVKIVKYYMKKAKSEDVYICAIAHPKFASSESIETLERFIKKVRRECQQVDFVTMQDVVKKERL